MSRGINSNVTRSHLELENTFVAWKEVWTFDFCCDPSILLPVRRTRSGILLPNLTLNFRIYMFLQRSLGHLIAIGVIQQGTNVLQFITLTIAAQITFLSTRYEERFLPLPQPS
jgi:hypothetical protein